MYLISIYFDEQSNKRIQSYIEKTAKATGNTFMVDHHVPPHITICAIEARSVEVLIPYMEKIQYIFMEKSRQEYEAISKSEECKQEKKTGIDYQKKNRQIRFVSTGQMLPYVFNIMPVMNEDLVELFEMVFKTFDGIPETSINKRYRPNSWMPHVTIGKTLEKDQMRIAFQTMQEKFAPFTASITEIGLAKVNPHEDVMRFKLS